MPYIVHISGSKQDKTIRLCPACCITSSRILSAYVLRSVYVVNPSSSVPD